MSLEADWIDSYLVEILPETVGVELIRTLRLELPGIKVLGLSMHANKDLIMALRRVGAAGLLTKDDTLDNLVAAIRTCVAGLKHC